MSESSTSVPSESDSPSTDPAEDILATSWSDVLEQFWIVQQKEAVAFYHGRVEPERKTWPAPLLDVPLDFVADCVEDELRDERQTVGKEALSMIALAAHMFVCELTLKSWHMKGTESLYPKDSTMKGGLVEISRSDVAYAVMHTDELDWMIDSILPEYREEKKLVDPSQLHVGFFRAVKVLDESSENEFDIDAVIGNPEQRNKFDIWLKRDYDPKKDRVVLKASLTVFFGDIEFPSISGLTVIQPDGSHAMRCIPPEGGRIDISFDSIGNIRLFITLPSRQLVATLLCVPFYAHYEDEEEEEDNEQDSEEDSDEEGEEDEEYDSEEEEEDEESEETSESEHQ